MPTKGHVIVGLSGGVDSAVSALRLLEQGYQVSGLFMQNWVEDDDGYCTAAEDFQEARRVAEHLDIPLHKVDFSDTYREQVFTQFLASYRAGRTPNPDVLCNREIKFAPFREYAQRLGADWVATGHYARIEHAADGPRLLRGVDDNKDQTYFLCEVPRDSLTNVLFPIGDLAKPEVRRMATDAGLPNHQRKDSTGICFIGERDFRAFLAEYLQDDPGPIVDTEGNELGLHIGLHHYTPGQRRGLAIGGQKHAGEAPWYVIGKDRARNCVIVDQNPQHPALMASSVHCQQFHWLRRPDDASAPLHARIRHRQALQGCRVEMRGDSVTAQFDQAQRAAVAGQVLAVYQGEECLGGGEMTDIQTLEALPCAAPSLD